MSDFLLAARAAGLDLVDPCEAIEDHKPVSEATPPRLLILQFVKPA